MLRPPPGASLSTVTPPAEFQTSSVSSLLSQKMKRLLGWGTFSSSGTEFNSSIPHASSQHTFNHEVERDIFASQLSE